MAMMQELEQKVQIDMIELHTLEELIDLMSGYVGDSFSDQILRFNVQMLCS